ncbi:MAG: hypothetical protein QF381_00430 [Nitrososphaerales archaeon]|jgi:hypothetical protein|nr:hypothetical protein [Nitrososphaerales archaeon]
MKIINLSNEEEKIRTFFKLISLASLVVIISTSMYGILGTLIQGGNVVGEVLVTLEVPPIEVFPLFYSKPITWLSAAILALYFSSLELGKDMVIQWRKFHRDILKFFAFFVCAMATYEVLFNFTLWGGLIASDSILGELNVDLIKNTFPNPETPWNIVFATKLFTVLTIISAYSFYYLQRIESKINERHLSHSAP